jgi:hypothetical protein
MAIIALKAWYLEQYEPIATIEQRPPTLRLNRNSLMRSALRADFLDDSQTVRQTEWFGRYLSGEAVEFYIEGSGGYAVANIDLISHEIYFTKLEILAQLEPIIYYCPQVEYPTGQEAIAGILPDIIQTFNKKSRLPLKLVTSPRLQKETTRLSGNQLRQIKKSLLFIADGTAIAQVSIGDSQQLLPSPQVCLEMGFALQSKSSEQLLLLQMERSDLQGDYPFDLPSHQQLTCQTPSELEKSLPSVLESLLQKYNLFT